MLAVDLGRPAVHFGAAVCIGYQAHCKSQLARNNDAELNYSLSLNQHGPICTQAFERLSATVWHALIFNCIGDCLREKCNDTGWEDESVTQCMRAHHIRTTCVYLSKLNPPRTRQHAFQLNWSGLYTFQCKHTCQFKAIYTHL